MNQREWETLLAVTGGEKVSPVPVGFIIDCPWLPNWAGMSILDYLTSETLWLEANQKAINQFPDIMFLPGYWSEYGMCTEPSAFGSTMVLKENEFPFAEPVIGDVAEIAAMAVPDPAHHGLSPMMLKRLCLMRERIEGTGHAIRFAVARGPMNIAAFLMGTTEFLLAMKTDPEPVQALLRKVNDFLVAWLRLQKEAIDTIDGILLLDDIVGFIDADDFATFAKPYLTEAFGAFDCPVRFFHNDAQGRITACNLNDIGVNLFNFSHQHSLADMKEWTDGKVTMLGNVPPRDVLARGTPDDVRQAVRDAVACLDGDLTHLILSAGGGVPPGVPTENIDAFVEAAKTL